METILIILTIISSVLVLVTDWQVVRRRVRVFWAFLTPVYLAILLFLGYAIVAINDGGDFAWIPAVIFLIFASIAIVANIILFVIYLHFTKRLSGCLNQKEKRRIWITIVSIIIVCVVYVVPNAIIGSKESKEGKEFSKRALCNIQEETIERWEQQMRSEGGWGITKEEVGFAYEYMKINKETCEENHEEREAMKERERIEAEKNIEHPTIIVPVI